MKSRRNEENLGRLNCKLRQEFNAKEFAKWENKGEKVEISKRFSQ